MNCPRCHGHGFLPVAEERNTVKPCAQCKPDQHQAWATGEYRTRMPRYDHADTSHLADARTELENAT